tara:strand:- start:1952 stop:2872 length:921 start_codon:yes stop_codon:yes gene_type:complete
MANILLRSPHFEYHTQAGSLSARLDLSLDSQLFYTLTKTVDGSNGVLFEISELARDYIDPQFSGTYDSDTLPVDGTITFYSGINNTGTVVGTPVSFSHIGFDGYSYTQDTVKTITAGDLLQSNTKIYVPDGVAGFVPFENLGAIAYATFDGAATSVSAGGNNVTIDRICDNKHTPLKLTFINKFGAYQDIWFDKKSVESMTASEERYKASIINGLGIYNISNHTNKILSKNGSEKVTINTGFIDEQMYYPLKEMILSESVWVTKDGQVLPVNLDTSSLTHKTKLNDKLIQYTIDFTYSFDIINTIR